MWEIFFFYWYICNDIQKWWKPKICRKFENEKKKKDENFFDLLEREFEPQIFSNFCAHHVKIKSKQASKRDRTLAFFFTVLVCLQKVIVGLKFVAFDMKRLSNGGKTFGYSGNSGLCMTLANISKEWHSDFRFAWRHKLGALYIPNSKIVWTWYFF